MNNPETYILKQNHFNRHLVDIVSEEKKTVIHEALKGVRDFDETTKLKSLNVFIAKENEKCVAYYLKQKKRNIFLQKKMFFPSIL